ncbi:MAG: ATP synthase F1 subunit delta [Clostridiales bacterium]|jgi:F-type H+-transporting ATPase subunit delta|nr:ATP synthase F1 subunit delta [Clostridiales bacterium]
MERIAVTRYTKALFEIAIEKNQVKEYNQAATEIHDVLASDAELMAVVNHLSISAAEKMTTIKAIFEGKIPDDFIGIMDLVLRRGRQGELLGILRKFNELYNEYIKVARATLYSPTELSRPKLNEIAEVLGKKLDKTVDFDFILDPALIAGFRVEVDGHVFDSSLKNQLGMLKRQLLA